MRPRRIRSEGRRCRRRPDGSRKNRRSRAGSCPADRLEVPAAALAGPPALACDRAESDRRAADVADVLTARERTADPERGLAPPTALKSQPLLWLAHLHWHATAPK